MELLKKLPSFMRNRILIVLMLYRLGSFLIVRSWFVPDEYWQSLEVAHHKVFRYGYLTWEWHDKIRSPVYPGVFALLYYLLKFFHLDYTVLLTEIPRGLQALLTLAGDWATYQLSLRLHGPQAAMLTLYCIVTSWFSFYCGARTLTNCAEASISALGYLLYPWKDSELRGLPAGYIWLTGLACLVRPTAAIVWLPLVVYHLSRLENVGERYSTVGLFAIVGVVMVLVQVIVELAWYGQLVFSPLNFLWANVVEGAGLRYGVHPWHWYLTQGLPVVLTTHWLPFLAWPVYPRILGIVAAAVGLLSLQPHKEFRFLLPVLPLVMVASGHSLSMLLRNSRRPAWGLGLLAAMALVNLPLGYYVSVRHKAGPLAISRFLRDHIPVNADYSALVLMPCHSLPHYSHIHKPIQLRFLTCEPGPRGRLDYLDEADQFFHAPAAWLRSQYSGKQPLPSHLVMFDVLVPHIKSFLSLYKLCFTAHYADLPDSDSRVGRSILVYCRLPPAAAVSA